MSRRLPWQHGCRGNTAAVSRRRLCQDGHSVTTAAIRTAAAVAAMFPMAAGPGTMPPMHRPSPGPSRARSVPSSLMRLCPADDEQGRAPRDKAVTDAVSTQCRGQGPAPAGVGGAGPQGKRAGAAALVLTLMMTMASIIPASDSANQQGAFGREFCCRQVTTTT